MSGEFSSLWRGPGFRRLWLAQCASQLGDRLVFVLLVAALSQHHAPPSQLSLALALTSLPHVLLAALAGLLADRLEARRVMRLSNMLRAVLVLGLGLFGPGQLGLAIAFATAIAIAAQPFTPAEAALLPRAVAPERLMQANAVSALTTVVILVVGVSLGEPLVQQGGLWLGSLVASGAFGLGAWLLHDLPVAPPSGPAPAVVPWPRQFVAGLRYLRTRGGLRRTIACQVAIVSAFAALSVVAIVVAQQVWRTGYGGLLAACGAGLGTGAWLIGRWGPAWPRDRAIAAGFVATGAILVALAAVGPQEQGLAFGLTFALGISAAIVGVPLQTRLQQRVEEAVRGQVFGLQQTVLNALAVVPLAGTGWLLERVGSAAVLAGLGSALALVGLAAACFPLPDKA
ncbi:MAG: MFS transporter [Candidatus Sericytochromatia bacterium]|nr:MFS transporter [Candidatus Sericytochromatia bacterium]